MKYLVLFFIALIATTYATPDCTTYCQTIVGNCTGANAQYEDMAACMAVCPLFTVIGTDGQTTGNTLGCRIYHANASISDPGTHCIHAGPTGGDMCGDVCEAYCNLTAGCTGDLKFFATYDFCKAGCDKGYNKTDPVGSTSGSGAHCHAYHAGVAASSAANAMVHCPHASPSGDPACGTRCENYCNVIMGTCTATNGGFASKSDCMAFCQAPAGPINATGGNSVECRIYHALAAAGDATTHCPHASPSGGNLCGTWCEVYCQLATDNCVGANSLGYADNAACMTACGTIANTGTPGAASGDSIQCRIYHLGAAKALADPATHCPHGKVQSATCNGGSTSSTTGGSSSSDSGTGNAFGVVVSFVSLIGFLLF